MSILKKWTHAGRKQSFGDTSFTPSSPQQGPRTSTVSSVHLRNGADKVGSVSTKAAARMAGDARLDVSAEFEPEDMGTLRPPSPISVTIELPDDLGQISKSVEPSKSLMDLLIGLCADYKLSPTGYKLVYSTGTGASANINQIHRTVGQLTSHNLMLIPKPDKNGTFVSSQPTNNMTKDQVLNRILIHLPKGHKLVIRMVMSTTIQDAFNQVCQEKGLLPDNYIVCNHKTGEKLDWTQTLEYYGTKEFAIKRTGHERKGSWDSTSLMTTSYQSTLGTSSGFDPHWQAPVDAYTLSYSRTGTPSSDSSSKKSKKSSASGDAGFFSLFRKKKKKAPEVHHRHHGSSVEDLTAPPFHYNDVTLPHDTPSTFATLPTRRSTTIATGTPPPPPSSGTRPVSMVARPGLVCMQAPQVPGTRLSTFTEGSDPPIECSTLGRKKRSAPAPPPLVIPPPTLKKVLHHANEMVTPSTSGIDTSSPLPSTTPSSSLSRSVPNLLEEEGPRSDSSRSRMDIKAGYTSTETLSCDPVNKGPPFSSYSDHSTTLPSRHQMNKKKQAAPPVPPSVNERAPNLYKRKQRPPPPPLCLPPPPLEPPPFGLIPVPPPNTKNQSVGVESPELSPLASPLDPPQRMTSSQPPSLLECIPPPPSTSPSPPPVPPMPSTPEIEPEEKAEQLTMEMEAVDVVIQSTETNSTLSHESILQENGYSSPGRTSLTMETSQTLASNTEATVKKESPIIKERNTPQYNTPSQKSTSLVNNSPSLSPQDKESSDRRSSLVSIRPQTDHIMTSSWAPGSTLFVAKSPSKEFTVHQTSRVSDTLNYSQSSKVSRIPDSGSKREAYQTDLTSNPKPIFDSRVDLPPKETISPPNEHSSDVLCEERERRSGTSPPTQSPISSPLSESKFPHLETIASPGSPATKPKPHLPKRISSLSFANPPPYPGANLPFDAPSTIIIKESVTSNNPPPNSQAIEPVAPISIAEPQKQTCTTTDINRFIIHKPSNPDLTNNKPSKINVFPRSQSNSESLVNGQSKSKDFSSSQSHHSMLTHSDEPAIIRRPPPPQVKPKPEGRPRPQSMFTGGGKESSSGPEGVQTSKWNSAMTSKKKEIPEDPRANLLEAIREAGTRFRNKMDDEVTSNSNADGWGQDCLY